MYEAECLEDERTNEAIAIKILTPVGYKLTRCGLLSSHIILKKGVPISDEDRGSHRRLEEANVWWLINPTNHQVVAAYQDTKTRVLKELTLPKCLEIWGWNPLSETRNLEDNQESATSLTESHFEQMMAQGSYVQYNHLQVYLPRIPHKFIRWLRNRNKIYREILNMKSVGNHPNVLTLIEVLELIQDSKSTIFLVLEFVSGGELFDKIGTGTTEDITRVYMKQLISGVAYCHQHGVCHRYVRLISTYLI